VDDALQPRDLDPTHARPAGVSDEAVAATGKLSETVERIERARGALYEFHQLMGGADAMLDEVVDRLRACGESGWAELVETEIKGRNAIEGRWSFQIVEEFDDVYYGPLKDTERRVREALICRPVCQVGRVKRRPSAVVVGRRFESGPAGSSWVAGERVGVDALSV
jgi:hypothetical protein